MNANIFGIRYDAPAAQACRFGRLGLETDRTDACDCSQSAPPLFKTFSLVQVGNPFFRDDMAHIIAVDQVRDVRTILRSGFS